MNMIKKLLIIAAITMAGITSETMLAQEHSITPDGTYLFVQRDTNSFDWGIEYIIKVKNQ